MVEFIEAVSSYGTTAVIIGVLLYLIYLGVHAAIERRNSKQKAELELQQENERKAQEAKREQEEYERYAAFMNKIVDLIQHGPSHTVAEQEEHRRV